MEALLKKQELKTGRQTSRNTSGELIVFAKDKCHLLAGDATGYIWVFVIKEPKSLLKNDRDRQAYYGDINLYNQMFFIKPYSMENGENTIAFLKDLQAAYLNKKLSILWDNACYPAGKEVKKYLDQVNKEITDEKTENKLLSFCAECP